MAVVLPFVDDAASVVLTTFCFSLFLLVDDFSEFCCLLDCLLSNFSSGLVFNDDLFVSFGRLLFELIELLADLLSLLVTGFDVDLMVDLSFDISFSVFVTLPLTSLTFLLSSFNGFLAGVVDTDACLSVCRSLCGCFGLLATLTCLSLGFTLISSPNLRTIVSFGFFESTMLDDDDEDNSDFCLIDASS